MALHSCMIGFLVLIFLFFALPSKIVIFVVKMKKSTSQLKDFVDLSQYIVFIFCGILGTCLNRWVPKDVIQKLPSTLSLPMQPGSEPPETEPKVDPEAQVESNSAVPSSTLSECPDKFQLIAEQVESEFKSASENFSILPWIVHFSLIISITLLNWNLSFDDFSPGMEIFAWSSNVSQLTVGIMAASVFSAYISELIRIKVSFHWINKFLSSAVINKIPEPNSSDLNGLVDFVATRYHLSVSQVRVTSKIKKFCFSCLFTVYLISLTSMTLESTKSISQFKSLSLHYFVTTATALLSLGMLFSQIGQVLSVSVKVRTWLYTALLGYPNLLNDIYPRLYLIKSSVLSLSPKFLLFGFVRLEVPLFFMFTLIFMVEVTRIVN